MSGIEPKAFLQFYSSVYLQSIFFLYPSLSQSNRTNQNPLRKNLSTKHTHRRTQKMNGGACVLPTQSTCRTIEQNIFSAKIDSLLIMIVNLWHLCSSSIHYSSLFSCKYLRSCVNQTNHCYSSPKYVNAACKDSEFQSIIQHQPLLLYRLIAQLIIIRRREIILFPQHQYCLDVFPCLRTHVSRHND